MSQYIQVGNTVRLVAQFYDWDGAPVDPALIKLIFYDAKYTKIDEYSIGPAHKLEPGKYYFDYVTKASGTVFYEWYGEVDGLPTLKRGTFTARQM